MERVKSAELFSRAREYLAGGVNSPVRAYKAVGGSPPFIVKGKGGHIFDADGNEYVDFVLSWGPLILGHARDEVVEAVKEAATLGTSFGAPCPFELELAELVKQAFPSLDRVRMVNSGTEATMSALRLARAATGRELIVKFEGCYHGHADSLLVAAGSGAATFGVPSSPGVLKEVIKSTRVLPYNDLNAVERAFQGEGDNIACVIVEPIAGNMGVVPPLPGFLAGLREITAKWGAVLIFDEVITGFRVAYGGAEQLYRLRPDITCLGKIIGGGLPVGAYGGKREIMELLAPEGPVYQAGTLAGNPLAMAAGAATLKLLAQPGIYERLEQLASRLAQGIEEAARHARVEICLNRVGSLLSWFFNPGPVNNYADAARSDTKKFAGYFTRMLDQGIYLAPSAFEAAFVCSAHSEEDIDKALAACRKTFEEL